MAYSLALASAQNASHDATRVRGGQRPTTLPLKAALPLPRRVT